VERVELVGASAPRAFTRDAQGLAVTLPERRTGESVYPLEISGTGLTSGAD
jgi:hypothetical protein